MSVDAREIDLRACLTIGFALIQCASAQAQTAECDKIKYTTIPIEVTSKGASMNRLSSGVLATDSVVSIPPAQIYRDNSGTTIVFTKGVAKDIYAKNTLLFGFVQS